MAHKGVIVAEGESEGVVEYGTREELSAFAAGLSRGAELYGAGGCGLYTVADLAELDSNEEYDATIIAETKKSLGIA